MEYLLDKIPELTFLELEITTQLFNLLMPDKKDSSINLREFVRCIGLSEDITVELLDRLIQKEVLVIEKENIIRFR